MILFTSCSLKTTEGLRSVSLEKTEVFNPYFSNSATDYVYKAKINIYGRYFGGIFIVKKLRPDTHRVVFTTEFGSKIFDFLYEDDTFTKNFVIDELNKKFIVNTLRNDFEILISERAEVIEQFASEDNSVFRTEANNRFNFYFFDTSGNSLERIVNSSKRKEKVEIVFSSDVKNEAQSIKINHANIKLFIDLEYFKNL
jgi:hypothetical protein